METAINDIKVFNSAGNSLMEAVKQLAFADSLRSVANIVKSAARAIAGAHGATFVLLDIGEAKQCFYYDEDAISPLWKGMKFPVESCISGWAMLKKEQVTIPDIYKDDRIPHDAYQPTFVKSLVMTPVRREEPIAAIGTYWSDDHESTAEELSLLQTLADITAVALEKIQWQQQAQTSKTELEKQQVTSSTLNQFRKDLLAHLTHDLRTSAIGLAKLCEHLGKDKNGTAPTDVNDALHSSTHQMLQTLSKIIDLDQHVIQDSLCVSTVCLNDLLSEIHINFKSIAEASKITCTISGDTTEPLEAEANEDWFRTLFSNLVSNAITFTPAFGKITISLSQEDGDAVIRIADTGSGIPEEVQHDLFNRFWLGDRGKQYYVGRGFGLYTCKRIVEAHSGTIDFVSSSSGGTTFTIKLPLKASI